MSLATTQPTSFFSAFNKTYESQLVQEYTTPNMVQTFNNMAVQNIGAYWDQDANNAPQNLLLTATANLNLESLNNANLYMNKGFNIYNSTLDTNNNRFDQGLLNIALAGANVTAFSTTVSSSSSGPNDVLFNFNSNITFNQLNIKSTLLGNDVFMSLKPTASIEFASPVIFDSNVNFKQSISTVGQISTSSSIMASGSIFGCNLNVWTQVRSPTNLDAATMSQIGYGFQVNSLNELELVKMATFGSNQNVVSRRIAVFGNGKAMTSADGNDDQYFAFNNLNGISMVSGGTNGPVNGGGSVVSVSPLDSYMTVYNGNIGVNNTTPMYGFDVTGTGHYTGKLTVGGILTKNSISLDSDNTYFLGTSLMGFSNMFTHNLTFNNFLLTNTTLTTVGGTYNVPQFTSTSTGGISDISMNNVVFGASNNVQAKMSYQPNGSTGSIYFYDHNGQQVTVAATVVPATNYTTNTSSTVCASIGSVNSLYTSFSTLSNVVGNITGGKYTADLSFNGCSLSNVLNMGASNITASNMVATSITSMNSIFATGADFAEYMNKANVTDTFAAGEVVGIDANGAITKVFANSMHFMVVSTNPALVGGGSLDGEIRATQQMVGFCGRLSLNLQGAAVGQYIVASASQDGSGGITPVAIADANLTFDQYKESVGRVIYIDSVSGLPTILIKSI